MGMKVFEYRFLTADDYKWPNIKWWSRPYEYGYAMATVQALTSNPRKVHNSAWGTDNPKLWAGSCVDHMTFREAIDSVSEDAVHSDIERSGLPTVFYNVTTPKPEYRGKFDAVLNISVIEHLSPKGQVAALVNLFDQVKTGGIFLATFDYPRVDTKIIQSMFGVKRPPKPTNILNGANSINPNPKYAGLNILALTVKKT